jgi:hypothetical protein
MNYRWLYKHVENKKKTDDDLLQVPGDACAVPTGCQALGVVLVYLDLNNRVLVLFHGGLESLRVTAQTPHAHLTLTTTAHNSLAVRGERDGGDATLMRIVDREHDLAALGVEGADLAVVPAAHDHVAIARERNRRAGLVGDVDAQELLIRARMPYTDVLEGACRE